MHIMVPNAASAGGLTAIRMHDCNLCARHATASTAGAHEKGQTQLCRLKIAYTAVSFRSHLRNYLCCAAD